MSLKQKLQQLCGMDNEIVILRIRDNKTNVDVLLPYESAEISIAVEGTSDEEIIESFAAGLNFQLDQMIDHLEGCKIPERLSEQTQANNNR